MDIGKQKRNALRWNRKIHMYFGLGLLLFIWVFGLSGILLNHHWEFTEFWEDREELEYKRNLKLSSERDQSTLVYEIMNKLELDGSIVNPKFSKDSSVLNFIIAKPGTRHEIQAGLNDGNVLIKEVRVNTWGVLRALHKIRNPTRGEIDRRYQSFVASAWSASIDIVSVGLIIICLGGWFMLSEVSGRRLFYGLVAIASGIIICLWYLLM